MTKKTPLTSESEEYLETIYKLEEKTGFARTSALAQRLRVAFGSITNTIKNLERRGLVVHKPYKGVKLTKRGRKIALSIIRKHRLSERLLTDILGLSWAEVHEVACKLEHSLTDAVSKAIEKTTGDPKTCPHGNPIPTESGKIPREELKPLVKLGHGEGGTIVKVIEEDNEMLRYLSTLGLVPGAKILVREKAPFNGPVMIEVMGANYAIARNIASLIWVRKS